MSNPAKKPNGRPTLRTIARLSGFAIPTVSRALANDPRINIKTRLKIAEIAQSVGYVPDRAAVRLKTGKTKAISALFSTETDMMNSTARLIAALSQTMRGTGYHLNVTHSFDEAEQMSDVRYVVETRSADVIVLNAIKFDDPRVKYLEEKNFPFVMHGRASKEEKNPYFDYDNRVFAEIGIYELARSHRQNILLIRPPADQFYSMEFLSGAQQAAAKAHVKLRLVDGLDTGDDIEKITDFVTRLLQDEPMIDGAIIATPNGAMAATVGFERNGRILGEDFDLVSKDAIKFLRLFRERIIVVEEDLQRAGTFLARTALALAEGQTDVPFQELEVPTA